MVTVSVVALPNTVLPFTCKSVVTVKSFPIVTSFGNPIIALTSVPTLVTAVSISFAVPRICKSSVNRSTFCAPASPSTVKAVATFTVLAAVNRPCWSTVNVGIAVVLPYEPGVTAVLSKLTVRVLPLPTVVKAVPPAISNVSLSKSIDKAPPESPWKSKSCAVI